MNLPKQLLIGLLVGFLIGSALVYGLTQYSPETLTSGGQEKIAIQGVSVVTTINVHAVYVASSRCKEAEITGAILKDVNGTSILCTANGILKANGPLVTVAVNTPATATIVSGHSYSVILTTVEGWKVVSPQFTVP